MDKGRIHTVFDNLFSEKLWTLDLADFSQGKRRFIKFIKLVRITLDTFAENRMGFQCVALSYFCTLALVPMVAIVFVVTNGLGLYDKIEALTYKLLPTQPEMIKMVNEKAANILNTAQSGVVGLISALLFVWTIIWMMYQIERVFNNVWGIRKVPRKIYKRFSFYLLTLILMPFVLLIFCSGIAAYSNALSLIGVHYSEWTFLPTLLSWVALYIVTVLTFSVMYKFIPAVKVKYRSALVSALFIGLVFLGFQYLYLETQMFVSRLNGVYGAIAVVPLFLIWLNFSWQIIIYGAELTYSVQNVDQYHIPDDLRLRDIKSERHREI